MTKKAGRPTKYKKKYAEMIVKFFKKKAYKVEKVTTTLKNGAITTKKIRVANPYPTFEAFATKIGVNGDTLVQWANSKQENGKDKDGNVKYQSLHPEFSAAYKIAKDLQKNFIIQAGLGGFVNPLFGIFVAKNTTDMKDKQELDHTSKGEKLNVTMVSYKDVKGSDGK